MVMEQVLAEMIASSGEARSASLEAIRHAKAGEMDKAEQALETAAKSLSKAHDWQTQLIHREAAGEAVPISLLLIHAQDHLMNAMTLKDLAREVIDLYRRLQLAR